MQTGGYDLAKVNETLLNRFLKLGHCVGKFLVFSGVHSLPIDNVPNPYSLEVH